VVLRESRRHRANAVHARSYVPAAIAWLATRLTRRPFIFDMRGFLGEEYVEGGHWSRLSLRYRVLRFVEQLLLRSAAEIVVLTEVAARRLRAESRYAAAVRSTTITVIPCAVDLERFQPRVRSSVPTLIYAGSIGMTYALDEMLTLYA